MKRKNFNLDSMRRTSAGALAALASAKNAKETKLLESFHKLVSIENCKFALLEHRRTNPFL
jgi:hypothetical protein